MCRDNEYNGWTNYETWRVNLELISDYDFRETFPESAPTLQELETYIKDFVLECISEFGEIKETSLAYSYASAFVDAVNYREIAEHVLNDTWDLRNCDDCDDPFPTEDLASWKYEPAYKLCDSCYEDRMREEQKNE